MDTFKTLKIPAALLLTAGFVSATLSVAKTDEQPVVPIEITRVKKKDKVVAKADYLPDVLGRIGYAIFMADQQQLENIQNYERPRARWVYTSDNLSVRNRGRLNHITYFDKPLDTSNESFDVGVRDDNTKSKEYDVKVTSELPIESDVQSSVGDATLHSGDVISESPESPELPEVPELPDTPELPEVPELPESPESPEVPELPDTPELPEISDTLELPELPEISDTLELPKVPELPEISDTLELPDVPDASGLPDTSKLPDVPTLLDAPELPDIPELPELPDMPELPDSPELPDMPELPDSPELPDMPELPDSPELPDIPELPNINAGGSAQPRIDSDSVMDKVYREEVVSVKQGQVTKYDPDLGRGETRFIPGNPGQIVKFYEDTYYNGALSYSTLLEEKTTVEPISDILYVGSKIQDGSLSIVDLKIGDELDHCTITGLEGDIKAYINASYYDLLSESEDTRFKKATSSIDASYSILDPREEEPFNHGYRWLGASDDFVTIFNSSNLVDKHKINEYLLNYINADREERGLNKLVIDPELQPLADARAQEMANYGHIHYQGKPHTRPNGTSWSTVLEQLPTTYKSYGFVENMLAYSVLSNPYQLVSEQWIAKRVFEQWKSSGPHYAAMMDPQATRTAVSVKLTTRTGARSENGTNWMIGAQLFSK